LLVSQLNDAGGLVIKGQRYNVEMIIYDDKYTAEGGRAAVERLVYSDGVKYIFQLGSAPTVAGLTITEPNKVLVISGAVSSKLVTPENKYTVRASPAATNVPSGVAGFHKVYPDLRTAVTLAPDDESGHALTNSTVKSYEAFGLKILEELYYPRDIVDWAPVATRVASLNPDFLELVASAGGADEGLMMQAVYDAGWRGVTRALLYDMAAIHEVCSNEAMEGAVGRTSLTEIDNPPDIAREFREAYIAKYGEWEPTGLMFVQAWHCFMAAVKKADSLEVDDILAAMEGLEFESHFAISAIIKRPDLGTYRPCDCVSEEYTKVIKNGKEVFMMEEKVTIEEAIEALEKVFGCPGQYR
jgi:branched-chain amino acid transport system substrate-binding protein